MNVDETGSGWQPIVAFDINCAATLYLAGYKHSCTLLFCTMLLVQLHLISKWMTKQICVIRQYDWTDVK